MKLRIAMLTIMAGLFSLQLLAFLRGKKKSTPSQSSGEVILGDGRWRTGDEPWTVVEAP